jgi:hypothetical protein
VSNLVVQGMVSQCFSKLFPSSSPEANLPEKECFAGTIRMIVVEQIREDFRPLNASL